jgi:hypothetical protein
LKFLRISTPDGITRHRVFLLRVTIDVLLAPAGAITVTEAFRKTGTTYLEHALFSCPGDAAPQDAEPMTAS